MPVRNEAGFIEKSLRSLLGQTYPSDLMEIIVADGMSTDSTREIVEKLAAGAAMQALESQLPAGTRSWVAWRVEPGTIAAVYLLDPTPPEDAHVLEVIVAAP